MQTYADTDYYFKEHMGEIGNAKEVLENLCLASLDIDRVTFNRIEKIGFDNLSQKQQELIKKACCYQADYIFNASKEMSDGSISSYSAGNVSVSYDTAHKTPAELERVSAQAYRLLQATGLMQRVI